MAVLGLTLTLFCFEVSPIGALYLALWLLVLLLPAHTAGAPHRGVMLVIPLVATLHVFAVYVHAVVDAQRSCLPHGCAAAEWLRASSAAVAHQASAEASFVMLFALATYRALWAHALCRAPSTTPRATDLQRLVREETLLCFFKRLLIRHSFHAVLVAVVALALECASVTGAAFLVGAAAAVHAYGGAHGRARPQVAAVVAAVASAVWAATQYAMCSPLLRSTLHIGRSTAVRDVLRIVGVPLLQVCTSRASYARILLLRCPCPLGSRPACMSGMPAPAAHLGSTL
jgi:hypothetical protein